MNGPVPTRRVAALLTALLCIAAVAASVPFGVSAAQKKDVDSVIVEKNLFRTDRQPPPPPKFKVTIKKPVRGLSHVKMEGLVGLGGQLKALVQAPYMFLDDESTTKGLDFVWVKVGDKLGQYTVKSIDGGKLVMEKDGQTHTLKLNDDSKKNKNKSPLFSKKSRHFRKPGSLFLVYSSNGTMYSEAEIPELGAPDLDPDSKYQVGGPIDIIADVTDLQNDADSDDTPFSKDDSDPARSSSNPWLNGGWTTTADASSAVASTLSTLSEATETTEPEVVPTVQEIEIAVQEESVVDEVPEVIRKDQEDKQKDKKEDPCDTCTCTRPDDWNPLCCKAPEECIGVICDVNNPANWNEACCGPYPTIYPDPPEPPDNNEPYCYPPWDPPADCIANTPTTFIDPVKKPSIIN